MIKIIHTADLHFGQELKGYDRTYEIKCFTEFLSNTVATRCVDALIISGDVFHNFITSNATENLFCEMLNAVLKARPSLRIIISSGNHDSAQRLDNLGRYCSLGFFCNYPISIVGSLPQTVFESENEEGNTVSKFYPDFSQLLFMLKNATGEEECAVLAFPYIRDLSHFDGLYDEKDQRASMHSLQENFSRMHQKGISYVREVIGKRRIPLIIMDHASVGNNIANRGMIIGGEESHSTSSIDGAEYVALGHIHKAQSVGKCGYYSGSPYPINFAEKDYKHEISLLTVDQGKIERESILVPRAVEMLEMVIPECSDLSVIEKEIQKRIEQLIIQCDEKGWIGEKRPFLKIVYVIPSEDRVLKNKIGDITNKKISDNNVFEHFRFCGNEYRCNDNALRTDSDQLFQNDMVNLDQLDPLDVFIEYFKQQSTNNEEPSDEIIKVFTEVLEECKKEQNDISEDLE